MLFALLITWTVVFVIIVFGIPQQSPFLQRKKPDWTTNWSSFQLLYLSPLKLKVLFFAHFFGYGAYLLITVYATCGHFGVGTDRTSACSPTHFQVS